MLIPKANVEHFKHAFGRSISIQKHPNKPQKNYFQVIKKALRRLTFVLFLFRFQPQTLLQVKL